MVALWWCVALLIAADQDRRPKLLKPTENQVNWQRLELTTFHHFGVNTYTNREWGLGDEDPNIFQPDKLDVDQWMKPLAEAGFKQAILTAKHHDGFMLFPSKFSNHSVASSSWRNGKGDVVRDFFAACRKNAIQPAIYLSPWDRNQYNMTWKPSYNEFYAKTLEEITTNYGPFNMLWFDGANAVSGRESLYDWKRWISIIRKNQPQVIAGGCGIDPPDYFGCAPDASWIGNEAGLAGESTWAVHLAAREFRLQNESLAYDPFFCDVSIRSGWFYHKYQQPKSLEHLVHIYFNSVGRNCVLQLNIPPSPHGLLDEADVRRVMEFGQFLKDFYATDVATSASVFVSSELSNHRAQNMLDPNLDLFWEPEEFDTLPCIELGLQEETIANVLMLQENIRGGQAIAAFQLYGATVSRPYFHLANSTTVGEKRLLIFPTTKLIAIKVVFTETLYGYSPQISRIGLLRTFLTGFDNAAFE
jgi:alpha-L-fucosidase